MIKKQIDLVKDKLKVETFRDCEPVITPKVHNVMYLVLEGGVAIIAEETAYKRVLHDVRHKRKFRKYMKKKEIKLNDGVCHTEGEGGHCGDHKEEPIDIDEFISDFPDEELKK